MYTVMVSYQLKKEYAKLKEAEESREKQKKNFLYLQQKERRKNRFLLQQFITTNTIDLSDASFSLVLQKTRHASCAKD